MVMQEGVIRVQGLRVRYPVAARDAVTGIDFAVAAGEVFGLLGPNGAGKSTTQRVLTGQHRRYTGRVEVLGAPVAGWGRALYERIGVGVELPAYFPQLTAPENCAPRAAFGPAGAVVAIAPPRNLRPASGRRSVIAEFAEAGQLRHAEFPATDDPGLLALLATGRVQTVHTREAALADVFIAVTNRTPAGATP